ncbi:hypothetical protein ACWV2X_08535 [Streptomyces hydrogenans]
MVTAFPTFHEYAMAHTCPTCKVKPGEPCNAPQKIARRKAMNDLRARFGHEPISEPSEALHMTRQTVGIRHRQRDIAAAPWPEDRIPGQRYDTLGDAS